MKDSEKINLLSGVCVLLVIVLAVGAYNYIQNSNDCQQSSSQASAQMAQISRSAQAAQIAQASQASHDITDAQLATQACQESLVSSQQSLQASQESLQGCNVNLQTTKDQLLEQQNQLRNIIWTILEPHSSKINITQQQLNCSLNRIYKKYTPFSILFTLFKYIMVDISIKGQNTPQQIVEFISDICDTGIPCKLPNSATGFCGHITH